MDDYIKRKDALKMRFTDGIERDCIVYVPLKDVISHLKSIHASDVRENVRGHWENVQISVCGSSMADCSICGATVHDNFTDKIVPNFCPNCGADMRR